MGKGLALRLLTLALIVFAPIAAGNAAFAQNAQQGDNDSETDQAGEAQSGDSVVGQVAGVVSSGDTSLDATNHSEDSDAETGDAEGTNTTDSFTGLDDEGCGSSVVTPPVTCAADLSNVSASNVQEGDNETEQNQAISVSSGDAVAGQVTGIVTSGSADVVVANTSLDVDLESGDASFDNFATAVTGLIDTAGDCCSVPTAADVVGKIAVR